MPRIARPYRSSLSPAVVAEIRRALGNVTHREPRCRTRLRFYDGGAPVTSLRYWVGVLPVRFLKARVKFAVSE